MSETIDAHLISLSLSLSLSLPFVWTDPRSQLATSPMEEERYATAEEEEIEDEKLSLKVALLGDSQT